MNVPATHVRMVLHVQTLSMAILAPVLMATLEHTVKQVFISYVVAVNFDIPGIEFSLTKDITIADTLVIHESHLNA